MKLLILGGTGMLGHKAWAVFKSDLDVFLTIRGDFSDVQKFGLFDKRRTICNIDVKEFALVEDVVTRIKPDVVLNCIGIIKQKKDAEDVLRAIEINSVFPHKLAQLCDRVNARLIHISTDCVFSGEKGRYSEQDRPDPFDMYGMTKLLGEVVSGRALTIRTSLIGHELDSKYGLIEWFLSQKGKTVNGYRKAIFSGFPTVVFCGILKTIIAEYPDLKGLYHVASSPIDKYSLLDLVKSTYGVDIRIEEEQKFVCDRSLNGDAFKKMTKFSPKNWIDMINTMKNDSGYCARVNAA
jgi:dTDP-4-dehydrorhamnose reductase